jgi:N-carbamoyl-L-amino-acid hydrolase
MTRTVRINRDRLWASLIPHQATLTIDLRNPADDLMTAAEQHLAGYVDELAAQEIAAICPAAMVFVAGENGGISHTPREYSNPGACANGTDVLANAVLRLADQP